MQRILLALIFFIFCSTVFAKVPASESQSPVIQYALQKLNAQAPEININYVFFSNMLVLLKEN